MTRIYIAAGEAGKPLPAHVEVARLKEWCELRLRESGPRGGWWGRRQPGDAWCRVPEIGEWHHEGRAGALDLLAELLVAGVRLPWTSAAAPTSGPDLAATNVRIWIEWKSAPSRRSRRAA